MWDKFTQAAQRAVLDAQQAAEALRSWNVSTEHLLLGLIRADSSMASWTLARLGVDRDRIRVEVERQLVPSEGSPTGEIQLTPLGKRAIDLAFDEAARLNNSYVGTEHLLLGLMREEEGIAGRVLASLGLDPDRTRAQVSLMQQTGVTDPDPSISSAWTPSPVQPQGPWYTQPAPISAGAPVAGGPLRKPSRLDKMRSKGGVGGAIATALIFLSKWGAWLLALAGKFKFLLILGKLLLTGGTMFLSMFLEAKVWGWPLAVGVVLSIFFHECGHAAAGRSRGLPISNMVFVPFMGAAVMLKRGGRTVGEDAFIGIMGPVFGTIYGAVCFVIYQATQHPFWLELAQWVFFINLFNLLPTAPLDGGWIVPVFSPKILALGLPICVVVGFVAHNPFIWLLGIASLPRIVAGWKRPPEREEYFKATARDRWTYAIAYPGLAAILALGMYYCAQLISAALGNGQVI